MPQINLTANIRSQTGKTANQALRKAGNFPAVLYGPRGNFSLEMAEVTTRQILEKMAGLHELVTITVKDPQNSESWTAQVLLKDVKKHPYKQLIQHLDFWELPKDQFQVIRVPMRVIGESPGIKKGGVVQMVVRDIPVSCKPENIPPYIEVDSSSLDLGDSLRIQDVVLPENVTLGAKENYSILSVVGRALNAAAAAAREDDGEEA